MANINLLPWREWERERKQKEFVAQVAVVLVIGAVLVFGGGQYLDAEIEGQKGRNAYIEGKIKVLDERISEISTLRQQREDLLARMRVIQELQGNRPVIVRVFDEIVRKLSKGVHFNSLKMQGNVLSFAGVAESNNRISTLMRNLNGSAWFTKPNRKSIQEDPDNPDYGAQASAFELTFVQGAGKSEDEEGDS